MLPAIRALALADPPEAWADLGFAVEDGRVRVGEVSLVLGAPGAGVVGWALDGAGEEPIDGLAFIADAAAPQAALHPNGALVLDHLVIATPDLDRTLAALARAGFDLRRTRDTELGGRPLRQAFYRAGEPVLEVVGPPEPAGAGPASFWGLTITVADLDALADRLGERLGPVHDAVQPGRRIASLGDRAGIATRLAFMSPRQAPPARR
jgi:hypothetical protein